MLKATLLLVTGCLADKAPPAQRQLLPDPLPDAAGSSNVISLSLISLLCAPRTPPASLAFIDSSLIHLEGEVGSNAINDGVHALLTAASHGKVTHRDPLHGLAIPALSTRAGLDDGDQPCCWDPCTKTQHPAPTYFTTLVFPLPPRCSLPFSR